MKTRELVMWLVVVALLVGTLLVSAPKEKPMAINFAGLSKDQYVKFNNIGSSILFPEKISIVLFYDLHSLPVNDYATILSGVSVEDGVYPAWFVWPGKISSDIWVFENTLYTSEYSARWSIDNTFGTNVVNNIVITYDSSSTSNDPLMYANGSSRVVTEIAAPSGSKRTILGTEDLFIGGAAISGAFLPINGDVNLILIYNRILTAAEISDIHSSRGASYPRNGLVFCSFGSLLLLREPHPPRRGSI